MHTNKKCKSPIFFPIQNKLLIISSLDTITAHSWDNISIKMIQVCQESITFPSKIAFGASLHEVKFLDTLKNQMWSQFTRKMITC